jgi:hypothetical protein
LLKRPGEVKDFVGRGKVGRGLGEEGIFKGLLW